VKSVTSSDDDDRLLGLEPKEAIRNNTMSCHTFTG
jgi:hypothetical protein